MSDRVLQLTHINVLGNEWVLENVSQTYPERGLLDEEFGHKVPCERANVGRETEVNTRYPTVGLIMTLQQNQRQTMHITQ